MMIPQLSVTMGNYPSKTNDIKVAAGAERYHYCYSVDMNFVGSFVV